MPPRKRARVSAASTPAGEKAPERAAAPPPALDSLIDPWTDDEETQLFKAVIKWKPTGINKHLHMMAIADELRTHGYAYSPTSGDHTRIPGIWAKLSTLYDLDALDTREDEYSGWADISGEDEEEVKSFALPEETFGDAMWQRRFQIKQSLDEDVEMKDADDESRETSPELIEGLNTTRCYIRNRPPHLQALVDKAAVSSEEAASSKTRAKKTAATRSSSGRTRATRSTPVQETEDDQDDEEGEEDESTTVGSPPSSHKGQPKAAKKRAPTRKSTRKSIIGVTKGNAAQSTHEDTKTNIRTAIKKAPTKTTKKVTKKAPKNNTMKVTKKATKKNHTKVIKAFTASIARSTRSK